MLDNSPAPILDSTLDLQPTWFTEALTWSDALYRAAHYLTDSSANASDCVHETFARVFSTPTAFAEGPSIRAVLYRVLMQTVDHDSALTAELDDIPLNSHLLGVFERERVREACTSEMLRHALMALSVDARMSILLDLEGLTEVEIAFVLGCARANVRLRVVRARGSLTKLLMRAVARGPPA